jgi:transposase-like protein
MKQHGGPKTIVTGGFRSYRAAMKEIGNWAHKKPVAGSTIEPKFQTNRSDEENERWRNSGAWDRFINSPQFTLRFTTISTRNVISTIAKSSN